MIQIINEEGVVVCEGKIYTPEMTEQLLELIINLGYEVKEIEPTWYNIYYEGSEGRYHVATTNDLKQWLVEHNSEREKGEQEKIEDFIIKKTTPFIYRGECLKNATL